MSSVTPVMIDATIQMDAPTISRSRHNVPETIAGTSVVPLATSRSYARARFRKGRDAEPAVCGLGT